MINKSMHNYKGDPNNKAENFNSNDALSINATLTFLMFIAILFYDGCTKDLEADYKQKYQIQFENFDRYLEEERSKAKEEAIDDIRHNLNKNTSN